MMTHNELIQLLIDSVPESIAHELWVLFKNGTEAVNAKAVTEWFSKNKALLVPAIKKTSLEYEKNGKYTACWDTGDFYHKLYTLLKQIRAASKYDKEIEAYYKIYESCFYYVFPKDCDTCSNSSGIMFCRKEGQCKHYSLWEEKN